MGENREMAAFAKSLWENYIKFRNKEADSENVSFYKAEVVAKPGNGKLTIKRPFDSTEVDVGCASYMESADIGTQVLVLRFGDGTNLANHYIMDNAARTMLASAISTGSSVTFPISISNGGTGATTVDGARTALGIKDASYVHTQAVASSEWIINHNLGFYPSVTVVDSAGNTVCGEANYTSINQVIVTFIGAFAGTAYLS